MNSKDSEANADNDWIVHRREGLKLFFEVFKHLTTISSGSILLLVTLLGRSGTQQSWLIAISFVGFVVSTAASIIVMLSTARTIRRSDPTDQLPDTIGNLAYLIAVAGFGVGITFLSIFGYLNL